MSGNYLMTVEQMVELETAVAHQARDIDALRAERDAALAEVARLREAVRELCETGQRVIASRATDIELRDATRDFYAAIAKHQGMQS